MKIFVFGSNLAGRHGRGAALDAKNLWNAEYGVGEGRTGRAYAVPTKDAQLRSRPLTDIKKSVEKFKEYARANDDLEFFVTAIGTGLAGYKHEDIGPMFSDCPSNCELPQPWLQWKK